MPIPHRHPVPNRDRTMTLIPKTIITNRNPNGSEMIMIMIAATDPTKKKKKTIQNSHGEVRTKIMTMIPTQKTPTLQTPKNQTLVYPAPSQPMTRLGMSTMASSSNSQNHRKPEFPIPIGDYTFLKRSPHPVPMVMAMTRTTVGN